MKFLMSSSKFWVAALMLTAISVCFAQPAPPGPPPTAGSYGSVAGTISQVSYAPEMEVTSFPIN